MRNWDLFYKRNTTNFFKDRHWLAREFPELVPTASEDTSEVARVDKTILEVGCGVGNTVFPIIQDYPNVYVHCCDFSSRAVEFVRKHELYNPERMNAFECDLTKDPLDGNVAAESVDCATMLFVLSAIAPENFLKVFQNLAKVCIYCFKIIIIIIKQITA